jgi:Phthiocerol/phthiodiolone dimycocerosyl transferase C-terminus/Condensation domain
MDSTKYADNGRPLGAMEQLFWSWDQHRPNHFVLAAEIDTQFSHEQWRQALDSLLDRNPLLGARIVEDTTGRARFVPQPDLRLPIRFGKLGELSWQVQAGRELLERFDTQNGPLSRLILMEKDRHTIVLFVAHHAPLDGMGATRLLDELMQLLNGKHLPPKATVQAPELVLADERRLLPTPSLPTNEDVSYLRPLTDQPPQVQTLTVEAEMTRQLVARCRDEDTTMHGLITASILVAGRSLHMEWSERPVRVATPVNIRGLDSSFENAMGVFMTPARTIDDSPQSAQIWSMADALRHELLPYVGEEGGLIGLNLLSSVVEPSLSNEGALNLLTSILPWDLLVTNLGRISFKGEHSALRVKSLWGPMVSSGLSGEQVIGVATLNDVLQLSYTSYQPISGLMMAVEQVLKQSLAA